MREVGEQGWGMGRDEARGAMTTWVQKNGDEQCTDTACHGGQINACMERKRGNVIRRQCSKDNDSETREMFANE
jgi:hypothetical protein